ncbi:nucleotidyltransferase domain-containing protein [Haloplanus halophilus]|uniref:nucleotidyltransferase domain-containing protein n=1 Tax=Haloplanus halophilus TaxID=2949993 RepID=UPI00203EFB4A|nr:nucleotidyltransferase domain-containing protein [Haloplanus sp. GDY1]
MSDEKEWGVVLTMPLPEEQVFRYRATGDVLELLYRNPHREFAVTELREVTGHGGKSVDNAIKTLDGLGLIERKTDGRKTLIRIDHSRIEKPDDEYLEIPQRAFREPVREFVREARDRQGENLVGIVLFGSVARGNADRASDIDIQVIVADDLTAARRDLQDVRQDIEKRKFDGERYELQVLVESTRSATSYGEKLREIFSEGIVLHSTDELDGVREAVFGGR